MGVGNAAFPGEPGRLWSPTVVTRRIRAAENPTTAIQGRYSDELLGRPNLPVRFLNYDRGEVDLSPVIHPRHVDIIKSRTIRAVLGGRIKRTERSDQHPCTVCSFSVRPAFAEETMGVPYLWRCNFTPDAVRQLSPRLRELLDSLERLLSYTKIWDDSFRAIPVHAEPFDHVSEIAKLLGIPSHGLDPSMDVALVPTGKGWTEFDRISISQFSSLPIDLFMVVNRLIAAGFNGILPPNAKVPLPSDQLMAQLRDVTNRFENLQLLIISNQQKGGSALPAQAELDAKQPVADNCAVPVDIDLDLDKPLSKPLLSVDGNDVTFEGKTYCLDDGPAAFVKALVDAGPGVFVAGRTMDISVQPHPERIFQKIPETIRAALESKRGNGYRIRPG